MATENETIDAKLTAEVSSASATPPQPAAEPKSLAEVARQAYESSQARVDAEVDKGLVQEKDKTQEEAGAPEAPVTQEEEVEKTEEEQVEEPAEEEPEKPEVEKLTDDKLPPFHKHPDFIKVKESEKVAKAAASKFEQQIKDWTPYVQQQAFHNRFCQENGIDGQEVNDVMTALAMRTTNPGQARQLMDKVLGTFVPPQGSIDKDLQEKVDDSRMTEEDAKELTQLRHASKAGNRRVQLTEQQKAEMVQQSVDNAITQWEGTRRQQDPSFKPGSEFYEVVSDRFHVLQQGLMNGQRTSAASIRNLEAAYTYAQKLFTSKLAPKPTKKLPSSRQNSGRTAIAEPKNVRDVVAQVARRHGLSFSPNGKTGGD